MAPAAAAAAFASGVALKVKIPLGNNGREADEKSQQICIDKKCGGVDDGILQNIEVGFWLE